MSAHRTDHGSRRPAAPPRPCTSAVLARVGALAGLNLDALSPDELRGAVSDIKAVRGWVDSLEARIVSRMTAFADAAIVAVDLGGVGGLSKGQVRGAMQRSETLDHFSSFADSLSDGTITAGHVDALGRGLRTLGDDSAGLVDRESVLLQQARSLPVDLFAKYVTNEVARQNEKKVNDEFIENRRRTHLKWWNDSHGMVRLSGAFDAERGSILVGQLDNAVEAMFHGSDSPVDVAPGIEPNDHRRALALMDLVSATQTGAGSGSAVGAARPGDSISAVGSARPGDSISPVGSARPGGSVSAVGSARSVNAEIIVTIDLETLRKGPHAGTVTRTSTGANLPVDVIRRMACEASIIPMVLNGEGVVIDVGRAKRLATRAQRQSIFAMHDTCAVPGCGVRVGVCVPHHIDYWEHGGHTDLSNLVPLCSRHHHAVHEGGWKLALDDARNITVTLPDGRILDTG